MKHIVTLAMTAALLSVAFSAQASNEQDTSISAVYGMSNGAILFTGDATRTGTIPACGTANPTRWALDASTTAGQAQASVLLIAYAMGKTISIVGANNCSAWGDTETVNYFMVND